MTDDSKKQTAQPYALGDFGKSLAIAFPKFAWSPPPTLGLTAIQGRYEVITSFNKSFERHLLAQPQWLVDFQKFSQGLVSIVGAFKTAMLPYSEMFAAMAGEFSRRKRIEDAGWLPHYTTPFDRLENGDLTSEQVNEILESHYRDCWPEVKHAFLERLRGYEIDAETKETFVEALDAHQAGFYRATVRMLFPEIERLARIELHAGSLETITSQHRLREAAGELGISEAEPGGIHGLSLFSKLFGDLYEHASTAEAVAAREADSVPNRHAALHGLVAYKTRQSSINALIMTDFIFQVICAVKRNRLVEAA